MQVIICKDYEEVSQEASRLVVNLLRKNPSAILGLATGSTPIGLYQNLIRAYNNNEISFKDVKSFNLDEYLGLPRTHAESFYSFMHRHLFDHIDIKEENVHLPNNDEDTLKKDINDYTEALKKNVPDLQILGIGANGHIGFNEPGSSFDSETFAVDLTLKTRIDNLRFFNHIDEVPTRAVTMGIKTIMRSRQIVLMATGEGKAEVVSKMINGPVTETLPASILQKHNNVVIILDELAASRL